MIGELRLSHVLGIFIGIGIAYLGNRITSDEIPCEYYHGVFLGVLLLAIAVYLCNKLDVSRNREGG